MPESNRIEVQLHLIANDDIDRLERAFAAFSGSIDKMGTHSRTMGTAIVGGTHGLPSQMSPQDFESHVRQSGFGIRPAGTPEVQTGKTGGLLSRLPGGGGLKGLYNELPGSNIVQKAGFGLAFGPQALNSAKQLLGAAGGAAYGGGFTQAGVNTGASASNGWGGSGFMSSAFKQGAQNVSAQFANPLDPFMGTAIGIAQNYGWKGTTGWGQSGPVSNAVSGMLKAGMSNDMAGDWLEQMRYGGTNLSQLTKRVKELGDTAKAAHMGLGNFNAQLGTAAAAMSQSTGVSEGFNTGQIMALSRATGLTPGALQPMMTNKTLQGVSVAMAGGDMAKAFMGRNAGLNNIRAMEQMIAPQLGYPSFKAVAQALKDPKAKHAILNKLLWLYQGAPDLFNGMTPSALLTMIQNTGGMSGITAGFHAGQDILNGPTTNFNANKIAHELSSAGMSSQVSKLMQDPDWAHKSPKDKIEALKGVQSKFMGQKAEDQASSKVSVTLTGYASKILKVAADQADVHPPDTATKPSASLGRFSGYGTYKG